ncbi:MAG TPA: 5-(carboxyamino)imidazole ribonucleotide mutase [Candidatus Methylacidiphilales bacterium]
MAKKPVSKKAASKKAASAKNAAPLVGLIMGSTSDWATLGETAAILEKFGVPYEKEVVSAHRTPDKLQAYAGSASARGLHLIIAGAGGAAHLPGMAAAFTSLPVLGVPVESKALKGLDSLLSIAQMPYGVPVGSLAIGVPGAKNAALLAVSILALHDEDLARKWQAFRIEQTETVLKQKL